MVENLYKTYIANPLVKTRLFARLHPNHLTLAALVLGLLTLALYKLPPLAALTLALSGILDTLDGPLARHKGLASDTGSLLDIFCDRIVELCAIFTLYAIAPTRALPCMLMIASSLLCITSFLTVGIFSQNASEKSFHYSPGLIERFEAFLFFIAMLLVPSLFTPLAYLYSVLVLFTALSRMRSFLKICFHRQEKGD
ncbi:MAG: CDP-alcohol phosphatidyltransferase family protein [Simkaniaceae bacterium]|nr:CDP-alcohol phosphatidyltransferase family protein [Simkaniaceae bacterium]